MGSHYHEALKAFLRQAQGNYGRTVAAHKVLAAGLHMEGFVFKKLGVACSFQLIGCVFNCVEGAGAVVNKIKKFIVHGKSLI